MKSTEKLALIDPDDQLSVRKQAELLQVNRSRIYYKKVMDDDSEIANLINEVYRLSNCIYGYRKIYAALKQQNYQINQKRY